MQVHINGKVYDSEDTLIGLKFFKNERETLALMLARNQDLWSVGPKGTTNPDFKKAVMPFQNEPKLTKTPKIGR